MSDSTENAKVPMDKDLENLLQLPAPKLDDVALDMIHHIAAGLEDPADIAARYGFEGEAWEQLQNSKAFQIAVRQQQAEYENDGTTFRNKNRLGASLALEKLVAWVGSGELSPMQLMKVLELLSRLGELEPTKQQAAADTSEKFTININVGGSSTPDTVDITPTQIEP